MDIVIDIDQTLFPLLRSMQGVPGGEGVREDCPDWHGLAGMCTRPLDEVIAAAIEPSHASQTGLYPGAKEAVLDLLDQDLQIALATHRHKDYRQDTVDFLEEQGLGFLPLWVGEDVSKTEILWPGGVLVDDAPHLLLRAYKENHRAASLLHSYNKSIIEELCIPAAPDWQTMSLLLGDFFAVREV